MGKKQPCEGEPEYVLIATMLDKERGYTRRGYVPKADYESGEFAVDSEWKNPPPGTLQVAIVPLPEKDYLH